MFRRYIASFAIVLFLVTSGFAQNIEKTGGYARILGMGNNPYIIDPYSTTVNPAWGAVYDNFLFGDLGSSAGTAFSSGGNGQFVSANFGVGRDFTLGMILSRNDFNGFSIARLDPFGVVNNFIGNAPLSTNSLNNNIELMGTMTFGKTSVGLGIAFASSSNKNTPAAPNSNEDISASQLGVNVGLLSQISGSLKLDIGASFMMPGATYTPPTGSESSVSQTIIGVNARLFWKYSSKLSFVPVIGFLTASGTTEIGGATSTSTDLASITAITAGIGINYTVGDFLLAGGPAFAMTSRTIAAVPNQNPEVKTSALTFPLWNLGLEWKMNDWLVGRLGYVGATSQVTNETPASATTINENVATQFIPYGATVGLGFRLGNFSLDATVNEDVLRQGLNNIGGGGPTFAYLSASYAIP